MAEQMQQTNPDLVEQLRRQMQGGEGNDGEGGGGPNNPPGSGGTSS